jgi:rRNA-processing protein FCF1
MSDNGKRGGPEPIVPLKGGDAFWLSDLYPDAKALFEHEQVSLDVASQDCMVVLDANVLLLPFEFTSASVEAVESVYKTLCGSGRLVVPGQAAREFYKNRSNKITAIADAIDAAIGKAKKQIFEKSIPLLEGDADYNAARELGKDLVNKGKEVAEKLEAVNERLKDEIGADRVSLLYRKLLGGCVSEFEVKPEDRENVYKEVIRRAQLKIAPGYKDQQKEDSGIGDYLVWQAILHEGDKRKVHCIFVTEEEKPDWWIKRHGTFQPRPELIEEYRRASGGKSLHLLPLSGLLAVFKASKEVVKQVQDVEDKNKVVGLATKDLNHIIGKNTKQWSDFKNNANLIFMLHNASDDDDSELYKGVVAALQNRSELSPSEFDAALNRYRELMDNDDIKTSVRRLRDKYGAGRQVDALTIAELNRLLLRDTPNTSAHDFKIGDDDDQ